MTFEEWWEGNSTGDEICEYLKSNLTVRDVWISAQKEMKVRASRALRSIAEEFRNDEYHGAAEVILGMLVE